jgi:hypothetical protein
MAGREKLGWLPPPTPAIAERGLRTGDPLRLRGAAP